MVPFVYLASVCRSLQCLIFSLTQAGGGGLLFRFASSVELQRGRRCRQTSLCVEHSLRSGHTGFASLTGVCFPRLHCSGSRLLYMDAGPAWRAVPVFESSTKAWTRLGLRLVPSPARVAQAARSLTGALSPGAVRLLPSVGPASVSAQASWVHAPVSILGS